MRKVVLHILSVVVLFTTLTSCENYLDVNKNPNVAEEVDPSLLFSTATVYYANLRSSGDLYVPMALAGQSIATGGSNPTGWGTPSEEQYQISPFFTGNTWRALYTNVAANLTQAIELAESATPVNNNAAAQAKVLKAMAAYDITTTFGDVPFSEAWNTEISYPHFDPQQQVLEGVVALLDEAYAQFDEDSPLKIEGNDLFYGGDISKWKRLARSVKLRTLMTMVDKDPSKAAAIGQMVTEGGMINSADDNALIYYQETSGRRNPKYEIGLQYNGGQNFFFGSTDVVAFMNDLDDPRLPQFFDKPEGADEYIGIENGETASDDVHVRISNYLHRADAPEVFFTYQEQLFYEAEVYARGLGIGVDLGQATTLYKQAVAASAKYFEVAPATAETFAASLPELSSLAEPVKYIHMHHWVDKMDRGLDAFTQWRRSGPEGQEVPTLTLPVGAPAGPLFRRYPYPITNEIAANPNAPQETTYYYDKVWFDI